MPQTGSGFSSISSLYALQLGCWMIWTDNTVEMVIREPRSERPGSSSWGELLPPLPWERVGVRGKVQSETLPGEPLHRDPQLHAQRPRNPHDRGEAGVAVFGQRLVKPLGSSQYHGPADSCSAPVRSRSGRHGSGCRRPGLPLRTLRGKSAHLPYPGLSVCHDCLEPLGLSVTEAARKLGVSRKQPSDVVNGHSGISPEMATRLDKAFGGDANTTMPLAPCLRNIPYGFIQRRLRPMQALGNFFLAWDHQYHGSLSCWSAPRTRRPC